MRLVELRVDALPGVEEPFTLGGLAAGVTVVVGPNASGKSSLVRALRCLWSQDVHAGEAVDVAGEFEERRADGVTRWRAVRLGSHLAWERDGVSAAPPPAPPAHLLDSYLVSIETLMVDGATDEAIGDRLHREMSGGYDLPKARQAVRLPLSGYTTAGKELEAAKAKVDALERERRALWSRWQERDELEAERAAASAEAARRERYEQALELVGHLEALRDAEARLAAYPAAMERLTGQELGELADLEKDISSAAALVRKADEGLAEARASLEASGLAGSGLDLAEAERLARAAQRLEELGREADALESEAAKVRGAMAEPWGLLGGAAPRPAAGAFEPANLAAVERALGERLAARTRLEAAAAEIELCDAQLAALERDEDPTEERPWPGDARLTDHQLHAARSALAGWLAAAPLPPAPRVRAWPALLTFLGGALFALAGVLALAGGSLDGLGAAWAELARLSGSSPLLLATALLAAVALVVGLIASVAGAGARSRAHGAARPGPEAATAAAAFERAGAAPPAAWEHDAVARRLEGLLAEGARRQELTERKAQLSYRAEKARGLRATAEDEVAAANRRLQALAADTGYDAGAAPSLDAGFAAWLRTARQVRDQVLELRGLDEQRRQLEAAADERFAALAAALAGTPFSLHDLPQEPARRNGDGWLGSKLPHAGTVRARCDALVRAVKLRDQARAAEAAALSDRGKASDQHAAAVRARAELFERLDLDPAAPDAEARLRELVDDLPGWRQAKDERTGLGMLVANLERKLSDAAPELLGAARAGEVAELEDGLREAQRAASDHDDLLKRLAELEEQVKHAQRERALETARAELQRRHDAVQDHRRRALLNAAAEVLFDDVEGEHRAKRQPDVLKRARAWFRRFTHHAFELVFEPNARPAERLRARDAATGRLLAPTQLSTGTRAQLLLALRVAHAAHAEGGHARLPFFLDEALTTADPERFAQVAASLLELARDDRRQVFYLSARREDALAWQRAAEAAVADAGDEPSLAVVDLARLRRLQNAERWAGAASLAPAREVPDPRTVPEAEFARAVGVTPVDPWGPPGAVHLYHLCYDDLALLRRLAKAEVLTVGQAKGLLEAPQGLLSEAQAALLARRVAGVEAWCEAWCQGRNVPLGPTTLEGSTVSGTFLERVNAVVAEVGGDPRALLDALRAGRVKFFGPSNIEKLEAWLDEHGYFDTRPRLDRAGRIVGTAKALAAASQGGTDPLEEARQLVERLEAAVPSEKEPA